MPSQKRPLDALTEVLGGAAVPGLEKLDDAELQTLVDAVRSARREQQRQLAQATDAALGHLPLLLRGAVRKILLPH
ncbi:hypothetical protein [Sinimarinibacterium thermocellulolyticum]|uniref:Uncharacterized protein n=1 Tax=Sinimarinibacterium thermocellulolyticum TaxID=3170016 RepID=A0ABV2A910_9GAMM